MFPLFCVIPLEESIDSAISSLLCQENSNTCFEFDDSPSRDTKNPNFNNQFLRNDNLGSDPLLGFLVLTEEAARCLVEKEREHLPRDDYLKRLRLGELEESVRNEAVEWISKAQASLGFGPSCFCLSVNYLDRFLSVKELADGGNGWGVQLLAVACLSIAAKMEESEVPKSVDLQVEQPNFVFQANSIQRMELMVLSTLGWRMQASTPCSFLEYFLRKMSCEQNLAMPTLSTSLELVLDLIKRIDFLEFRPSEIAAAVAIYVSRQLQAKEIDDALTCFDIVDKDKILKCLELIGELSGINVPAIDSNSVTFAPKSPIGVLDSEFWSTKSDETTTTVGSYTNSSPNSANAKRHKSNGPSFHP